PSLFTLDVVARVGISISSPVAEVKRTLSDSPYTSAVAMTLRRGTISRRAIQCFQAIVRLRPLSMFDTANLRDRSCGHARAIDEVEGRLLFPHAPAPFAWGVARQFLDRRRERSLRSVTKLCGYQFDRRVGIAQHVHGSFEPLLAQPGVRRKPGALLEGAA